MALVFLVAFAISLSANVPGADSYTTSYLEESGCPGGRATFQLSGSGPSSAALLHATGRRSYSLRMQCQVRLMAPPGFFVLVSLREVDFRMHLDGSCMDYIQIQKRPMCQTLYQVEEQHHIDSQPSNEMEFIYFTGSGLNNRTLSGYPGFQLTYTAFSTGGQSNGSIFKCENGNEIWNGLTCDGHNNCGDLSDEEDTRCGGSSGGSTVLAILGILIVCVLLVMCAATLLSKNERVRSFSTRLRRRTLSFMNRNRQNT